VVRLGMSQEHGELLARITEHLVAKTDFVYATVLDIIGQDQPITQIAGKLCDIVLGTIQDDCVRVDVFERLFANPYLTMEPYVHQAFALLCRILNEDVVGDIAPTHVVRLKEQAGGLLAAILAQYEERYPGLTQQIITTHFSIRAGMPLTTLLGVLCIYERLGRVAIHQLLMRHLLCVKTTMDACQQHYLARHCLDKVKALNVILLEGDTECTTTTTTGAVLRTFTVHPPGVLTKLLHVDRSSVHSKTPVRILTQSTTTTSPPLAPIRIDLHNNNNNDLPKEAGAGAYLTVEQEIERGIVWEEL